MPLLLEDTAPQPSTSFWNRFLKNKDNPNSFITFRDNDLQMNMSYRYDTPFGYYFYPIPQTFERLRDRKSFEGAIPFAGDRQLIVWADLDRKFSDKILRIDEDGNSQFSDEQIVELGKRAWEIYWTKIKGFSSETFTKMKYINSLNYIFHRKTYLTNRRYDSKFFNNHKEEVIEDINEIKKKAIHDLEYGDPDKYNSIIDLCDMIIYSDDISTLILSLRDVYMEVNNYHVSLYNEFLSDKLENRLRTMTNALWYFTYKLCDDAKLWTKLLYKLGFVGVVDEGSGTIHTNEPYQAVFFVSAALGGLTVYNNPKDVRQLNLHQQEVKKKEPILKGDISNVSLKELLFQYNEFIPNTKTTYDEDTNTIEGDLILHTLFDDTTQYARIYLQTLPKCLKGVTIDGDFSCEGLGITSLQNFPKIITGYCDITDNPIKSLVGSPEKIGWSFICTNTKIKSTYGICQNIGGNIRLDRNMLLSELTPECISKAKDYEDRKITLNECGKLNFKNFTTEQLLQTSIYVWDKNYNDYLFALNERGYNENKQPIQKDVGIKLDSFKLTSKKFKDYILREEVFNRGQLDLDAAWEVYQKQYQKSTGNTFTKELFIDRARNWTFYGNIDGWVAVRYQASGYVKLVAVAGSMKGKYYGMEELLKTNPPLWGAVTSDIADMLKKRGFVVPNYFTMKILIASVPPAVFGGKKVDINFDGSINVDYDGIGSVKKWFVCNKTYIKKFLNENNNIPAIAKTAIGAFL